MEQRLGGRLGWVSTIQQHSTGGHSTLLDPVQSDAVVTKAPQKGKAEVAQRGLRVAVNGYPTHPTLTSRVALSMPNKAISAATQIVTWLGFVTCTVTYQVLRLVVLTVIIAFWPVLQFVCRVVVELIHS